MAYITFISLKTLVSRFHFSHVQFACLQHIAYQKFLNLITYGFLTLGQNLLTLTSNLIWDYPGWTTPLYDLHTNPNILFIIHFMVMYISYPCRNCSWFNVANTQTHSLTAYYSNCRSIRRNDEFPFAGGKWNICWRLKLSRMLSCKR